MKPLPEKTTYRMVVAYDGTDFSGWQVQKNDISIQGLIEKALTTITHEEVRVIGAGRTDAGVHALGQSAHFRLEKGAYPFHVKNQESVTAKGSLFNSEKSGPLLKVGADCAELKRLSLAEAQPNSLTEMGIDCEALKRSLNGLLPHAIRCREVCRAPEQFHAQQSAIGKEYHYHICLKDIVLPFDRPYVWHNRRHIDCDLLEKAARYFIGEHDFLGFANAPGHGCVKKTSVRTIRRLDVVQTESGLRLEFEGNGFLYKMVRNITGMLMSVASGKRQIADIEQVFTSKNRRLAEPAAPAQGLFLVRVFYPDWVFENY